MCLFVIGEHHEVTDWSDEMLMTDAQCVHWLLVEYHELMTNYFTLLKC